MSPMKTMLLLLLAAASTDGGTRYDPLALAGAPVISKTFEVEDTARHRTVPVRIYFQESGKSAPVILFSHGLGGSRDNNAYLGRHWAGRGYAAVFVQHPGSDEDVWKNAAPAGRMAALKRAASAENYLLRIGDIGAVLDDLEKRGADPANPLHGRLDLQHVGMSGHSFGCVTTEALAGLADPAGRASSREPRISAAVMMSPSVPARADAAKAFATITIPCLLLTGTLDDSPIGDTTAADRREVFRNLANAPAWQVVFDRANHMSFSQRGEAGNPTKDDRFHRAILALTTAFWDAELKGNKDAKAWLNGPGAKSALDPQDEWEINGLANGGPAGSGRAKP